MRTSVAPIDRVVPDSVGSGPHPKTAPPAASPHTMATPTRPATSVIDDAYFASTRRERRTGRTRR